MDALERVLHSGRSRTEEDRTHPLHPRAADGADRVELTLENAPEAVSRRSEEQLALALDLALGISNADTVHDGLVLAVGRIGAWGGWKVGEAWVRTADGASLEHGGAWFASASEYEPFERQMDTPPVAPGVGLPGRAWSSRRPVWISDVTSDPFLSRSGLASELGLRTAMAVPIMADDEVVAVLIFFDSGIRHQDSSLVEPVAAIAARLGSLVERKGAEERLKESEARYRLLAENSTDLIAIADPKGTILYVSPSCAALSFVPEEMIGRSGLDFIHEEDADLLVDSYRSLFEGLDQITTPAYRGLRKDGTYGWWEATVRAIRDPSTGKVVETQASSRDITDRRLTEEKLELARAELERRAATLERSNMQLERFACDVSHDLEEPLRILVQVALRLTRGYADELDGEAVQLLVLMVDGLDRMQSLVGDLLRYSRFSLEPPEREPIDCSALLQETLILFSESIEERKAVVTFDPLPTVNGQATQLGQVFQNLLCNALKFSVEGKPPRIHLAATREPGLWRFSVRDNGIGVDPADAPRAFQMFGQLNSQDAYAGSGMGLSICKRIIEHHGGQIWLEPAENAGSVFYFTIPDEKPA